VLDFDAGRRHFPNRLFQKETLAVAESSVAQLQGAAVYKPPFTMSAICKSPLLDLKGGLITAALWANESAP
jgi:hypothetical protein